MEVRVANARRLTLIALNERKDGRTHAGRLAPILQELKCSVGASRVLRCDETPLLCSECASDGGSRHGYWLVYVADRDEVVCDSTLPRGRDGPHRFLRKWRSERLIRP